MRGKIEVVTDVTLVGSDIPYHVCIVMGRESRRDPDFNITVAVAHGDAKAVYADRAHIYDYEAIKEAFFQDPIVALRRVLDGNYISPYATLEVFDDIRSKKCMLVLVSDEKIFFNVGQRWNVDEVVEGGKERVLFGLRKGIPFGTALLL